MLNFHAVGVSHHAVSNEVRPSDSHNAVNVSPAKDPQEDACTGNCSDSSLFFVACLQESKFKALAEERTLATRDICRAVPAPSRAHSVWKRWL